VQFWSDVMSRFTRTWWGDRFIKALESFSDERRLQRGRAYASGGKVLSFHIDKNHITAQVRGSINPYYGVYKEPIYDISIEITPIAKARWKEAINKLSSKASIVSRLLINEVPENIEDTFSEFGLYLLPHSRQDFKTRCSCPDYANPCKHIAGDHNPFLLFELRGLSKTELQTQLAQTPLGKALSQEINIEEIPVEVSTSFYTKLQKKSVVTQTSAREFWLGTKRLPQTIDVPASGGVSAILIKKQGDFPPFWQKDNSFIAAMEEIYQRVKTKNQNLM
jgi:uncharacterized Zn finger protein